jgi:hypothetical protein
LNISNLKARWFSVPFWLLTGSLLCACDVTAESLLGRDDAAENAGNNYPSSYPCEQVSSFDKVDTGDCSMPYAYNVFSNTDGDNGEVIYYFQELADGNYPVVQSLRFQATEIGTTGGGSQYETKYDIFFNCVAEADTADHLRPYRCKAQSAPRLRSTEQPGGGKVKMKEMVLENPSCHNVVTYTSYSSSCYPGNTYSQPIKSPILGLVKP